jgi:hypothetical protein
MRMVLIACRPYWLVILIVALLQVCAMAEGLPSSSEGVLRSMPPLSQSGTSFDRAPDRLYLGPPGTLGPAR